MTAQNVGIGTASPQSLLSVGVGSPLKVDNNGNLTQINNVPYTFPAVQGAVGKTLVNDGTGNFSWKEAGMPIGSIVQCKSYDTASLKSKGFVISALTEIYERFLTPVTGNWTPYGSVINLTVPGGYYMQSNPRVWSGTEVLVYYNNYVYRWNPAGTSWTLSAVNSVPGFLVAFNATAVWDGTKMIVFGGNYINGSTSNIELNDCYAYTPGANTWSTLNAPFYGMTNPQCVWTGTHMLV